MALCYCPLLYSDDVLPCLQVPPSAMMMCRPALWWPSNAALSPDTTPTRLSPLQPCPYCCATLRSPTSTGGPHGPRCAIGCPPAISLQSVATACNLVPPRLLVWMQFYMGHPASSILYAVPFGICPARRHPPSAHLIFSHFGTYFNFISEFIY